MNVVASSMGVTATTSPRKKANFSVATLAVVLIGVGILLSALGVVTIKDRNRRLFIQYQTLLAQQQSQQINWGKLLLEQSTWSAQARIQAFAHNKLAMYVPRARDIVMVEQQPSNSYSAGSFHAPKVLAYANTFTKLQ